jgi:hypothetical protein
MGGDMMERHMSKHLAVVSVAIEDRGDGGLKVSSETLPGLILSGRDKKAVWEAIAPAIVAIFQRKGKAVTVYPSRPFTDVMRQPSPRAVDMQVHQEQFVVELLDAA